MSAEHTFAPEMCLYAFDVDRYSIAVCVEPKDHEAVVHAMVVVHAGERNVWLAGASPRFDAGRPRLTDLA